MGQIARANSNAPQPIQITAAQRAATLIALRTPQQVEWTIMPTYEPGDYIKVEFADEDASIGEWMWVRIRSCDDAKRLVFGTLDNVPLNAGRLQHGSELAISFDQIREHRKSADFDVKN